MLQLHRVVKRLHQCSLDTLSEVSVTENVHVRDIVYAVLNIFPERTAGMARGKDISVLIAITSV